MSSSASQLHLHSIGTTPNGKKITVALEMFELAYTPHLVNVHIGEGQSEAFQAINPNGKIPAIVDTSGGEPVTVWESGAILIYLAEKTGKFLPASGPKRAETVQWLMWQMAGLGPMTGQFAHFSKFAPERVEYGVERYGKEVQRLLGVLEKQLEGKQFVVGDEITIADFAIFPWVALLPKFDGDDAKKFLSYAAFPNLVAYIERVGAIPAVQRGMEAMQLPPKEE